MAFIYFYVCLIEAKFILFMFVGFRLIVLIFMSLPLLWGSGFSSYKIELRNQVTQNDVTGPITNLEIVIEIFLTSYSLDFVKH